MMVRWQRCWRRVERALRLVVECLSATEQAQVRAELVVIIEALERIVAVLQAALERDAARA